MGARELRHNEDLREEFTFGDKSLLSEWKRAILRELTDPASQMQKQDLAVAHQVIERFLEVIGSIDDLSKE